MSAGLEDPEMFVSSLSIVCPQRVISFFKLHCYPAHYFCRYRTSTGSTQPKGFPFLMSIFPIIDAPNNEYITGIINPV